MNETASLGGWGDPSDPLATTLALPKGLLPPEISPRAIFPLPALGAYVWQRHQLILGFYDLESQEGGMGRSCYAWEGAEQAVARCPGT